MEETTSSVTELQLLRSNRIFILANIELLQYNGLAGQEPTLAALADKVSWLCFADFVVYRTRARQPNVLLMHSSL